MIYNMFLITKVIFWCAYLNYLCLFSFLYLSSFIPLLFWRAWCTTLTHFSIWFFSFSYWFTVIFYVIWHGSLQSVAGTQGDSLKKQCCASDRAARPAQAMLPEKPRVQRTQHPDNPGTYFVRSDGRSLERERCENHLFPWRWRGKESSKSPRG